jgi:hypothetical protein
MNSRDRLIHASVGTKLSPAASCESTPDGVTIRPRDFPPGLAAELARRAGDIRELALSWPAFAADLIALGDAVDAMARGNLRMGRRDGMTEV